MVRQKPDDLSPQRSIYQQPVHEEEHRPVARVVVADRPAAQARLLVLAELREAFGHQAVVSDSTGSPEGDSRSEPTVDCSSSRLPSERRNAWVTITWTRSCVSL